MKYYRCLALLMLSVWFISCSSDKSKETNTEEEREVQTVLLTKTNEVTTMPLKKGLFNHELVSNGKISAQRHADLYFRSAEPVAHVWVKNGEQVRKGQKIAELDRFKLENTLTQRKNTLDQSILEMQDVLIGQGYAPEDSTKIPADVMRLARVKSGYEQNRALYDAALNDLQQATLKAPFDGIIANLFDKEHNMAQTAEPFCRVIESGNMDADFTVLESELPLIKAGDKVEIRPYASAVASCSGAVSEINPLVDENGMVRVKARVNGGARLFDGMNVRVSVKRSLKDQLTVPKTAVVLRSGKQVVFTLDNGKAMWNYVQTGTENLDEYTITDGLTEGMIVITSGNVNLAHESPVTVINQ